MKTNLTAVWNEGLAKSGTLKADYLDTKIAVPVSNGGSGDGANPSELLVASATTCYIATLTAMLERRELAVDNLTVKSEASTSKEGMTIHHEPQIVLKEGATDDDVQKAERAIIGANRACDVGNILKKGGIAIEVTGNVTVK